VDIVNNPEAKLENIVGNNGIINKNEIKNLGNFINGKIK
jgi:hypothetical protein